MMAKCMLYAWFLANAALPAHGLVLHAAADALSERYAGKSPEISETQTAELNIVDGLKPNPLTLADRPWVMAYRGASATWPEHSIGAYKAAIEQGTAVQSM
jgi:glycerophosphoryl diester phosphodiesterase